MPEPDLDNDEAGEPEIVEATGWSVPQRFGWPLVRVLWWIVVTVALAIDDRTKLGSRIPGDIGDAYLVMTLLDWGGDRALDLFSGFWSGPFFAGHDNAMAYSDTFLPLAIPFELLATLSGSPTIAFNLLFIAGWVVCAEGTYHLAMRLVRNPMSAVVVATAFTFSTLRLSQVNHFQLVWSGLVPVAIVLLFRLWDRPTVARAGLLAIAVLAQVLISAYHGVILALVVSAAVAIVAVKTLIDRIDLRSIYAYATYLVTVATAALYFRFQYNVAADGAQARTGGYPAGYALRLGDLRAVSPNTTFLDALWLFGDTSAHRSSESYAYVGAFVIVGIPLFVAMLVRRRQTLQGLWPGREWLVIAAFTVVGAAIAVGRGPLLGVELPFYDLARHTVPGVSDMVAIVRLFQFAQLGLALASGVALSAVLRTIPSQPARVVLVASLMAIVLVEGAIDHPMTSVVEASDGSVNRFLDDQDAGVAVLLPIVPADAGIIRPFVEAPRMVLGLDDEVRTVNGYSGYTPVGYDDDAELLNGFPSPAAVERLRELDVRFVAFYTEPLPIDDPGLADAVNGSGWAFTPADEVERRLSEVPADLVLRRYDAVDGVVIELVEPAG